jgi:hypothetical protein
MIILPSTNKKLFWSAAQNHPPLFYATTIALTLLSRIGAGFKMNASMEYKKFQTFAQLKSHSVVEFLGTIILKFA